MNTTPPSESVLLENRWSSTRSARQTDEWRVLVIYGADDGCGRPYTDCLLDRRRAFSAVGPVL